MPLFTIDISSVLSAPVGSIEEFQFSQIIPPDTWNDLVCEEELEMHIKIIRQEYGVDCILDDLKAIITIPSEGIEDKAIDIHGIAREFHLKKTPKDTDDISYINAHDATIDLTTVLEQELLISGL